MRTAMFMGIGIALSAAVMAGPQDPSDTNSGDDRGGYAERCLVSFDSAQHDVCTGNVTLANPDLKHLADVAAFKDSPLRLIKFDGPITEQRRAAVLAAGYEIVDYAPYNAFVVRATGVSTGARLSTDGIVWSGPFLPVFKVDVNLARQFAGSKIIEKTGVKELVVSLNRGGDRGAVDQAIQRAPGLSFGRTMTAGDDTRLLARFEPTSLRAAVEQLAADPGVSAIGPRWPVRLLNAQADWLHQSNVNAPSPLRPVFDRGIFGCGQIVGVLDTGLHMAHCSFNDTVEATPVNTCSTGADCPTIANPNAAARKVISYYKWSGGAGSRPADDDGHGTHVAGSVAGQNPANAVDCTTFTTPGGNTDLDGTAPGAKLVMQEMGADLDYLNYHGGNPYHAADTAYANGARLHSNSWGAGCVRPNEWGEWVYVPGCTVTYDAQARDADLITRDRSDLVMLVAAGNDASIAPAGYNVGSPGNAKNVITVGATERGAQANAMADFSSRGPTNDARTKPDITAQGSDIRSAGRNACGTEIMSGTSMATPTAAGLAALVREYLQRGFYPTGQRNAADAIANPSNALIKAILIAGAMPMTGTGAGTSPGQSQGWGRILLDDSLYFNGDGNRLFIHDAPAGLITGGQDSHTLTVAAGQPLNVALTWTDPAAAIGANPALVNSLRLEVVAPNGSVWTQKLPAGVSTANANPSQSTTTTNYDNRNNVHRISFANPAAGSYTVRVRGINVPSGPQRYALAVTGNVTTGGGAANQAPVANFTSSTNGLTATFTDSSTDADGTIASRVWNFGDGTTSTAANPSKTYTAAGTYTVTLTVTDNAGAADSETRTVTVASSTGTPLTNGVPVTNLSAAVGVEKAYTLTVPAGAVNVRFLTSGGSGNVDVYAKYGSAPTTSVYDCISNGSTNAEACEIPTARAGTYHVLLRARSAYAGASLTGIFTQKYSNTTDYAILDHSTVESPITVSGRQGKAQSNSVVEVAIVHTYQGDLKVDLVAPDGTLYNIHNRTGATTDNINKKVTLDLSGKSLSGTWKLRVNDDGTRDVGRIDSWSITF